MNVMKDYSEKRDFHRMQVESEIEITDSKADACEKPSDGWRRTDHGAAPEQ